MGIALHTKKEIPFRINTIPFYAERSRSTRIIHILIPSTRVSASEQLADKLSHTNKTIYTTIYTFQLSRRYHSTRVTCIKHYTIHICIHKYTHNTREQWLVNGSCPCSSPYSPLLNCFAASRNCNARARAIPIVTQTHGHK